MSPVTVGSRFVDAGAGWGLVQWWLCQQGADVFSVDRVSRRSKVGIKWRGRFPVKGLRGGKDLIRPDYPIVEAPERPEPIRVRDFMPPKNPKNWPGYPQKLVNTRSKMRYHPKAPGTVYIYNNDLGEMDEIRDGTIDGVVSISSLEHNHPDELGTVVDELMRVLKPGGVIVATLGSARDEDWFHEPSKGWCYTEQTLRKAFDIPASAPTNYDRYDELMAGLKNSKELREGLADFYYKSGNNGMPWGKWDPQYPTVGVVKVKRRKWL